MVFDWDYEKNEALKAERNISFEKIKTTMATANLMDQYTYPDNTYLSNNKSIKFIYYRIKIIDRDGTSQYSPICKVNISNTPQFNFTVYPSPATEKLFVQLADATTEVYYITVTDVNGKSVIMLPQPEIQKGIDISHLANGIYFIQLMDKKTKTVTTQKFVKQ